MVTAFHPAIAVGWYQELALFAEVDPGQADGSHGKERQKSRNKANLVIPVHFSGNGAALSS
jgi:hypothetical protein